MLNKARLEEELQGVVFSKRDQEQLKIHLQKALATQKKPKNMGERPKDFWHGTIEIPLPLGVALLFLVAFGLWNSAAGILLVDQNTATLLLHSGEQIIHTISQGVSVL